MTVRKEVVVNVQTPNFSSSQRDAWEKYLPVLLALAVAWFCARGFKKIFWMAFGLFWAFHWLD